MRLLKASLLALSLLLPIEGLAQTSAYAQEMNDNAWKAVLAGIEQDMRRRVARVEEVRLVLPKLIEDIQITMSEADNRLTQLLILRGVAGQTPWSLRTLHAQYLSLDLYLQEKSQDLELAREHLRKIKTENATLRHIREKDDEKAYAGATVAALEEPARRLEALKGEIEGIKADIDANLEQVARLRTQVATAHKALKKDYIEQFRGFFFGRTSPPLDTYGLHQLSGSTSEWLGDFQRFITPVFSWTQWPALAGVGLSVFLVVWLAGLFAARRFNLADEGHFRSGWPLLSFGVVFYVVTLIIPFTASHPLNLLLVVMAEAGATVLFQHHLPKGRLWLFFQMFVLGALAEAVSLPAESMCVVWPLAMSWGAWRLWRMGAFWQSGVFLVLAFMALLGFAPPVQALTQAWFLLLVTVGAVRALRVLMAELGENWLRYVHPLCVAVLTIAFLAWVLIFTGGMGFMEYVFGLELDMGKAKLSLDAVAAMTVLFFVVRLTLTWLAVFVEKGSFVGKPFDPALGHTIAAACSYTFWLGYILVAFHILGFSLSALTWIASGLSVGVGFGLKDIINNFVSGLIILFGGSIKRGDVIQTGKLVGEVVTVSVRNTTVRTLDNSMLIIPNSSFLKGEIINWSYQDKRIRLTIPVSVIPGTKLKKVRKLLLNVAKEHALVLKDPAPSVLLRQFGKLGLEFELYVWIEDFRDKFKVESDMATTIDQVLQENKITLAFQSAKVKYKPKGSEDAQAQAAREALIEKRRKVFALVRPLKQVHMRAKWGVPAGVSRSEDD